MICQTKQVLDRAYKYNKFSLWCETYSFHWQHSKMGVVDLWKLIADSERKFSLEQTSNFSEKKGKGLRVAIDVALWAFQARASVVGE
jgi:hypothetical protein